jgi:hypothetical protein
LGVGSERKTNRLKRSETNELEMAETELRMTGNKFEMTIDRERSPLPRKKSAFARKWKFFVTRTFVICGLMGFSVESFSGAVAARNFAMVVNARKNNSEIIMNAHAIHREAYLRKPGKHYSLLPASPIFQKNTSRDARAFTGDTRFDSLFDLILENPLSSGETTSARQWCAQRKSADIKLTAQLCNLIQFASSEAKGTSFIASRRVCAGGAITFSKQNFDTFIRIDLTPNTAIRNATMIRVNRSIENVIDRVSLEREQIADTDADRTRQTTERAELTNEYTTRLSAFGRHRSQLAWLIAGPRGMKTCRSITENMKCSPYLSQRTFGLRHGEIDWMQNAARSQAMMPANTSCRDERLSRASANAKTRVRSSKSSFTRMKIAETRDRHVIETESTPHQQEPTGTPNKTFEVNT